MGLVAKGLQKHFDKLARQLLPVALARINDKRALAEVSIFYGGLLQVRSLFSQQSDFSARLFSDMLMLRMVLSMGLRCSND